MVLENIPDDATALKRDSLIWKHFAVVAGMSRPHRLFLLRALQLRVAATTPQGSSNRNPL
jgi:hypothetical protein